MKFNRKIPGFIFLAVYLFTASTTMELFKLPALIGHYYDHREENRSMTLSRFLLQHYLYEDGTDKDIDEDNKLPFKSFEIANSVSFISLAPPNVQPCLTNTNEEVKNLFGIYTNRFLPSQYLNAIWHPPC